MTYGLNGEPIGGAATQANTATAGTQDNPHRPQSIEDLMARKPGEFYVDDAGNLYEKTGG